MKSTEVESVLSQYPDARREHLIPVLQAVQDREGYLSREAMEQIGQRLHLPVSKVYGVATFYNQFRFQPRGQVHCQVCRGTACHVKGSAAVLQATQQLLKIEPGQTTRDGKYSLEVVACIGACGLSPVITVNGDFHAAVTPDSVQRILKQYGKPAATAARSKVAAEPSKEVQGQHASE
ncbi:MAG: NADH-quinone oxidoreductase subunit NuoE [Phycisphaerae bacterium]|jgi:NADH-quinone oxidoreductase subunit E